MNYKALMKIVHSARDVARRTGRVYIFYIYKDKRFVCRKSITDQMEELLLSKQAEQVGLYPQKIKSDYAIEDMKLMLKEEKLRFGS